MNRLILLLAAATALGGCVSAQISQQDVAEASKSLDFGDYQSVTLATKGWEALAERDYTAVLAYTKKCVELYGEEGKRMNAELTTFAPVERVNNYWALNDAGTCMYIMANAYEKLRMYPEASQAYLTLADDYFFAQCWDPKGWYWHPAEGARAKAEKLSYR